MSTSEAPTPEQAAQLRTTFESFIHNTSLVTLVVAPVLILLPPRKVDFYTFSLAGAFTLAGSHLWSERQERLGINRIRSTDARGGGDWALPAKAAELQAQMKQRRVLEQSLGGSGAASTTAAAATGGYNQGGSLLEERAKEMWLGGQTAGWKERRLEEERRKLAEGEGLTLKVSDLDAMLEQFCATGLRLHMQ
ncbi:hypothetical protein DV735_g1570, partial [Chaetothyriales sp. CBS 134920]